MGGVLIFNNNNWGPQYNGMSYQFGGYNYNYPVREFAGGGVTINTTIGSPVISVSDFLLELLPLNGENTNKPIYPFLCTATGHILEIEYVIDSTTAVLTAPCTFGLSEECRILDTLATQPVQNIYLWATLGVFSNGVVFNSPYGEFILDISDYMLEQINGMPLSIDSGATGYTIQMLIHY